MVVSTLARALVLSTLLGLCAQPRPRYFGSHAPLSNLCRREQRSRQYAAQSCRLWRNGLTVTQAVNYTNALKVDSCIAGGALEDAGDLLGQSNGG